MLIRFVYTSFQNMVMRAAIGDFEETQIYGSLQQNGETSSIATTKRQFFLPDIRSFALVALEIVSKMCERRFLSMQCDWDYEQDPTFITSGKNGDKYTRVENNNDVYSDDSEYEDENIRRRNAIFSPYELIEEEKRKRSRSHSPGSRPLSAQSKRSTRSRTLSPDLSRWHNESPAAQTLYAGRSNTPDFDQAPSSGRVFSPVSKSQQSNRTLSPEPDSRPPSTPGKEKKKEGKNKRSKSKERDMQAFEVVPISPKKSKGIKKTDSKKILSKPVSL